VVDALLGVADEKPSKRETSNRVARAAVVGVGGLASLVAASAGISALRRRAQDADDGS
jgi:hypothetical protein